MDCNTNEFRIAAYKFNIVVKYLFTSAYIIAIHICICKNPAKSLNVLNIFTFVFQCQIAIIKYY